MSNHETIFNSDDYRIFDALAHKRKITGGLIGWVQAYKNPIFKNNKPVPGTGELLYDNHNLILASGRNIVAYKMFDQADALELKTYKVSHFGVGAGGATIDSTGTYVLNGPFICDVGLSQPISLGTSSLYLNDPTPYSGGGVYSNIGALKPITTDGSIEIEDETFTNSNGGTCTYGTKVKCTCTISETEPTELEPGTSIVLSEACLYATNIQNEARAFAKICIPPKYMELGDVVSIIWYVLC